MNLSDGYAEIARAALRGIAPDPELLVDLWAEEHMVLPKDSPRGRRYRLEYTPMARRIMRCLSPSHPARRVVIRGASQMLKTQVAMNFLGAMAHKRPGNMLVLEPTTTLAKRLSARIGAMVRAVDALRAVFASPRSRDSRNTTFAKDFEGGTVHLATFGSAANLREVPAPYVYVDEVDGGDRDVDGEGDPVLLAEARTTAFEDTAKILHTSSPARAGASRIDELYEMGTQEVYLVPCPHCGHHHELLVENFRYERDPDDGLMRRAWFVCPACGCEIDEREKFGMLRDAELGGTAHWQARSRGDGETVSFHVSAFYAGIGSISWLKLAREHARAKDLLDKGSPGPMQVFYNTRLALSWANDMEQSTAQELMDHPRVAPRTVPDWALVVTIAVDTQPNRLEAQAEAWGPGLEHAVIDYAVFMGSPTEPPDAPTSVWRRLDEYRATTWAHESGVLIPASVYAIDTGGHNTQDVYNYAAARVHAGCLAVHGSSRPNRPIIGSTPSKADIDWQGKRVDGGVLLWTIGTDVAKDHLHNRFKLLSGPGAMHFAASLDKAWFEGLLAERAYLKRKPGGGFRRVWEKASHGDRNEPLDLSVYNLALAHHLGLHKWTAADWTQLRRRLVPAQVTPDLFAVPQSMPPASPTPAPPAAGQAPAVPTLPPVHAVDHYTNAAPASAIGRRIYSRGLSS